MEVIMATYMITFDERTADGKHIMEFLQKNKRLIDIKPSSKLADKQQQSGLDKALDDVKHNRIYTAKNTKDLMQKTTK